MSRLPDTEGDKPKTKRVADYEIGSAAGWRSASDHSQYRHIALIVLTAQA
jgi:hypothetical protein